MPWKVVQGGRKPGIVRCPWCGSDPLYVAYHDEEWGVPSRDDRHLFEKIVLEGAQAGLSWITILRKREAYQRAFGNFDPERVARFTEADVQRLLGDAGIVRNEKKIRAAIHNAKAFLEVQAREGSFASFYWGFVDGKPIQNRFRTLSQLPASTPLSEAISKEMKRRGFTFVGPVTTYATMQSVGLVNDHLASCFRHAEVARLGGGSSGGAR
jgi:DNA-3-methyladenine glycosylase I